MKYNNKIVVTSIAFSKNLFLRNKIAEDFSNVEFNEEGKRFNNTELIDYMKTSDGAIVGLDVIDEELLNHCKNLKIISKYGVGLNNIDLIQCREKNVAVGWTGGVNKRSVSEMTLGFMLMLCRNLFITSNQLKNGNWNKAGGFQLSEKTIGLIGIGHIGKDLISLLKPFNCKILVNDIIDQEDYYNEHNLIEVSKEKLFRESDIISIHTPYTTDTENMVNLDVLKEMKESAFLINTARGGIVNEGDLEYALKNNIIAGAALDAYIIEPPVNNELISLPNLISTPHIGGNALEAVESMGLSAIEHLKLFFKENS